MYTRSIPVQVALLLLMFCAALPTRGHDTSEHSAGIQLLGSVALTELRFAGTRVHELSGLAWEAHTETLYAVSDRGVLVHMRPRFDNGRLVGVQPLQAVPLLDVHGVPLAGDASDSEGLALHTEGTLLVSFERRPRICPYHPDGHPAGPCLSLPAALREPGHYRGKNLALEAVAAGPFTGPEAALQNEDARYLHIYSGDRHWQLPAQHPEGYLTGLDTLPDGRLLVLERRRTMLPMHTPTAVHLLDPRSGQSQLLLDLSTTTWPVANYEGIAARDARHFFLISDDNAPLPERALLLYVGW